MLWPDDGVSEREYKHLEDKSDEWLFEALRFEIRFYQERDAVPMAERWPGFMRTAEANVVALVIELERRGYNIRLPWER